MIGSRRTYLLLVPLCALQLRADIVPILLGGIALPILMLALFPALSANVSGVVLVPLLGVTLLVIPQAVARLRRQGQFTYFAGLAISRYPLLLALLTIYAVVALLATSITTLATMLIVQRHVTVSMGNLIVVIPLVYLALAGFGMLLGIVMPHQSGVVMVSIMLALLLLAGMPPLASQHAPQALTTLAGVLPLGLAQQAFTTNQVLSVVANLSGLLVYAPIGFFLSAYILPWRIEARANVLTRASTVLAPPPTIPMP